MEARGQPGWRRQVPALQERRPARRFPGLPYRVSEAPDPARAAWHRSGNLRAVHTVVRSELHVLMHTRVLVFLTAFSTAALGAEGLTVGPGGTLLKDGRAYRAIGVNCFDAFERVLKNPEDSSLPGEFKKLAEHGIPFV